MKFMSFFNRITQISMNAKQALEFVAITLLVSIHVVHTSVSVQQDILVSIVKPISTNVKAILVNILLHA